jgi:hypothetical protein
MTKLSTTARAILTAAADRDDRVALPPERLPAAARRAVVQSLLKFGLIEEVAADNDQPAWRTESGERFALRVTEAGLRGVGAETPETAPEPAQGGPQQAETASAAPHAPEQADAAQDAPVAAQARTRPALRTAAQAVMAASDEASRPALPGAISLPCRAGHDAVSTRACRDEPPSSHRHETGQGDRGTAPSRKAPALRKAVKSAYQPGDALR